jgi:light-regulated signal transduction histidine kinase (bacteriophytochrome)
MQGEIKEGKITSLKELETKYGKEFTSKVGMGKRASLSKRIVAAIETEADKILNKAKEIEKSEAELKRLQKAAEQKLKDLDTKVKANPQQKSAYQKEARDIIKQYNRTVIDAERTIGRELSKMTTSELTQLQGKSPFVDKMLKANGKVDNFVKKSKAGKFMLGFGLMSLVGK